MTLQQSRIWLGIDTSTRNLGLALLGEDGGLRVVFDDSGEQHSRRLIPMLEELTGGREAMRSICEVAVNTGPGSFTGLRVGIAAARGLAAALEIPLRGVDSFDAHAASGKLATGLVVVLLNVSRGEVAAGCRGIQPDGQISSVGEDLCGRPEVLAEALSKRLGEVGFWLAGDAAEGLAGSFPGSAGVLKQVGSLAEATALVARSRNLAGKAPTAFDAHYLRAAEAEIRKSLPEALTGRH